MRYALIFTLLILAGCVSRNVHVVDTKKTDSAFGVDSVKVNDINPDKGFIDIKVTLLEGYDEYDIKEGHGGCFVLDCLNGVEATSYRTRGKSRTKPLNQGASAYQKLQLTSVEFESDLGCKQQTVKAQRTENLSNGRFRIYLDRDFLNQDSILKLSSKATGLNFSYRAGRKGNIQLPNAVAAVVYDGFCES